MIIFSVDFIWPAADHMMIKCHRIEKPCKSPAVLPTCFPSLSAGRRAWCWCAKRRYTPPPPRSSTSTASRSAAKAPKYFVFIYLRICRRMSTPWPRPRGSVLTTQTPTTPTPTPPCPTPATTGRLGRQPASRVNKTLIFLIKSALVSSTENKFMFRVTSLFPADRT